MRSPTWAEVALAFLGVVQTVALAWIARRGVILPPTMERAAKKQRKKEERPPRAE